MKYSLLRNITAWLILYAAFILLCTLYPFDIHLEQMSAAAGRAIVHLQWDVFDVQDTFFNVLLFLPLGICIALYQPGKHNLSGVSALATAAFVSFGFSLAIELYQLLQPDRFSSLNDIAANTAGGIIGCSMVRWKYATLVGYVLAMFVLSALLQTQTALTNWDRTYPLLAGNERTGDRQWHGSVSDAFFSGRALSALEIERIFADEEIGGESRIGDLFVYTFGTVIDRSGDPDILPVLDWRGVPGSVHEQEGVVFEQGRWLESVHNARVLSDLLAEHSRFTLGATVSADNDRQYGPARILSLSFDPGNRNFTLGQEGSSLIFRLRSPFGGLNGSPDFVFPGVFPTGGQKRVIVRYNGAVLEMFVGQAENRHAFELSPGAVAINYFIPAKTALLKLYKLAWYALVFIPLGLCLAVQGRGSGWSIFIAAAVILPALAMEGVLISVSGRDMIPENLLACMFLTAIPLAVRYRRNT